MSKLFGFALVFSGVGIAAFATAEWLGNVLATTSTGSQLVQVAVATIAGIAAFLAMAWALRIQEVATVAELVRRRIR